MYPSKEDLIKDTIHKGLHIVNVTDSEVIISDDLQKQKKLRFKTDPGMHHRNGFQN